MAKDKKTLKILSNVNQAFIESFPNSKKIYVSGSQEGVNVPMREIMLTDTIGDLAEKTILFMFMIPLEFTQTLMLPLIFRKDSSLSEKNGLKIEVTQKDLMTFLRNFQIKD